MVTSTVPGTINGQQMSGKLMYEKLIVAGLNTCSKKLTRIFLTFFYLGKSFFFLPLLPAAELFDFMTGLSGKQKCPDYYYKHIHNVLLDSWRVCNQNA